MYRKWAQDRLIMQKLELQITYMIINGFSSIAYNYPFFILVLPKFSVSISGPKYILPNVKAISFSIQARYVVNFFTLFAFHKSKVCFNKMK